MVEKATEAVAHEGEAIESIIAQVFQLYSNLLMEEARRSWCKILGEQIDVSPWHDLFGVKHAKKCYRSWCSLMDCVTFHLLSVFRSDAAETQRFYISNGLKKPNRVPIRQFMQRVQQLNGYLDGLSCLFYSVCATKLTKVMEPFNDADLASHILRMVPRYWHDQYELTGATVPQSVCKLLEALERIETAFPTKKECKAPKESMTGGGSSKKRMVTFSDRIPKKPRNRMRSTVPYASSMGTHTTPITWGSAISMRRTVLQKGPSQGRVRSATRITRATEMCHTNITLAMCSCPRRLQSLKSLTRNSSARTKSASAVATVTATTPTHPEVMGLVALGNEVLNVRNVTKLIKVLTLTTV